MPIGNDSYVNNTLEILKAFLVSSYPIEKRKKVVSGLGLKKEDLNKRSAEGFPDGWSKKHNVSSKMFSTRKESLLYDYHIVELPSNERGKFYGITPLGISYFCNNVNDIDSDIFEKIYSHLKFFYEKGKPKGEKSYLDKLENILKLISDKNNTIGVKFKEIFSNFKIEHNVEDYIFIKLIYSPTAGLEVLLSELIYSQGFGEDGTYNVVSNSNEGTLLSVDRDVDVYTFNYILSKFLIKAFLHSLYFDSYTITSTMEQKSQHNSKNKAKITEKLKIYQDIRKAFKKDGVEVVKEFQDEINNAIKLYMDVLKSEIKPLYQTQVIK